MKLLKPVIVMSLLGASLGSFADSFIRVMNHTSIPLEAIWQASGCVRIMEDPAEDTQYTVCKSSTIYPGEEDKYNFSWEKFDRSIKVYIDDGGRIGYCNSMDYASVDVIEKESGEIIVETVCP